MGGDLFEILRFDIADSTGSVEFVAGDASFMNRLGSTNRKKGSVLPNHPGISLALNKKEEYESETNRTNRGT
jgi:hypothetical protein